MKNERALKKKKNQRKKEKRALKKKKEFEVKQKVMEECGCGDMMSEDDLMDQDADGREADMMFQ